jgi:hypothetical protein
LLAQHCGGGPRLNPVKNVLVSGSVPVTHHRIREVKRDWLGQAQNLTQIHEISDWLRIHEHPESAETRRTKPTVLKLPSRSVVIVEIGIGKSRLCVYALVISRGA